MTDVVVYSALYGRCDTVKPAPVPGAIMYCDEQAVADIAQARGWEARVVNHGVATLLGDPKITAPMLAHKWWKTHPDLVAPDAEVTVWMDASMEVTEEGYVERCRDALQGDQWSIMAHPERRCIYDEATYSAVLTWRYDAAALTRQAEHYRQFHPAGWGLFATGNLIRRHTWQSIEISHAWWHECITWSHQDQVSLPVLFALYEQKGFTWNTKLPWHQWWKLHEHGWRDE